MAPFQSRPKLSLLAQFDDISRCNAQLTTGIEDEFLIFIKNVQACRSDWNSALEVYKQLQSELEKIKKENCKAETKLKHMRSLVETEMQKRQKIENEKRSLERQIAIIKEVLLSDQDALNDQAKEKLAFLKNCNTNYVLPKSSPRLLETIEESMGSVLSSSDVSFDKTDDLDENEDKDIYIDDAAYPRPCSKRSSSHISDEDGLPKKVRLKVDQKQLENFSVVSEEPGRKRFHSENTPLRRPRSSGRMYRNHEFSTKTVIRPETCMSCGKKMKFSTSALKCQDCGMTCHPECKEGVSQACIPKMLTPTRQGMLGNLADYVPSASSPMIPALIFHCIKEIERRGLNKVGLYNISGSEREVKELKNKFLKGKSIPCMNKQDIFALCSTVKEFLRSLHEPLVTRNLWRKFVDASEMPKIEDGLKELYKAIDFLPQANRDTLSFLMLHLNKILEKQATCKMSSENLSNVFGSIVVGYSSAEPSDDDITSQKECQFKVMQLLLRVPNYYWEQFAGENFPEEKHFVTPEPRPELRGNLLGPLSGSSYKNSCGSRGVVIGKTPLTPRGSSSRSVKSKKFFSSPLLK